MTAREEKGKGAALVTALLLGVPAVDLLVGGNAGPLHAVFGACGIAFAILWLKEVA